MLRAAPGPWSRVQFDDRKRSDVQQVCLCLADVYRLQVLVSDTRLDPDVDVWGGRAEKALRMAGIKVTPATLDGWASRTTSNIHYANYMLWRRCECADQLRRAYSAWCALLTRRFYRPLIEYTPKDMARQLARLIHSRGFAAGEWHFAACVAWMKRGRSKKERRVRRIPLVDERAARKPLPFTRRLSEEYFGLDAYSALEKAYTRYARRYEVVVMSECVAQTLKAKYATCRLQLYKMVREDFPELPDPDENKTWVRFISRVLYTLFEPEERKKHEVLVFTLRSKKRRLEPVERSREFDLLLAQ